MDDTWHPGRATNMTKLVGRQQDLGMTSQIMRMTKEDLVVLTFSLTHLFPLILKIVWTSESDASSVHALGVSSPGLSISDEEPTSDL